MKKRGWELAESSFSNNFFLKKPFPFKRFTLAISPTKQIVHSYWKWRSCSARFGSSLQWLIVLHSFALFSGICPQLLNTHKPSSVAAADVNRHLATAFWCKSSSTDTVFKRGAQRKTETQKEIDTETQMTKGERN